MQTVYPDSFCASQRSNDSPVKVGYDVEENNRYPEGVYPLTDNMKSKFYVFEYHHSEEPAVIDLTVAYGANFEARLWADSAETRETGDAILSTANGVEQAALQSPKGETLLVLSVCPQSPLEAKDLVALLNKAAPQLFTMERLP